jgi:hypothetical protein
MIFSRYLRTLERDGIIAVFHALKPIPAFVDTTAWQEFSSQWMTKLCVRGSMGRVIGGK